MGQRIVNGWVNGCRTDVERIKWMGQQMGRRSSSNPGGMAVTRSMGWMQMAALWPGSRTARSMMRTPAGPVVGAVRPAEPCEGLKVLVLNGSPVGPGCRLTLARNSMRSIR